MINLTPIPQQIQKRLFEKMKVLGRETSTTPNQSAKAGTSLNHAKMATRSTFLRMTSGQINPVILMGGKLKEGYDVGLTSNGGLPGGYDEIYGSRTYQTYNKEDQSTAAELYTMGDFSGYSELELDSIIEAGGRKDTIPNKNKRPTPGVKSVDVSFKGGVRALREATISWTCWTWEDLDYLMPHFLAHGKTVMIEWGWVYDENTLRKLPNFLGYSEATGNFQISADAYENYRNKVVDTDGDFDMMVGIVKNFEFTTREDGGFDCQTILSSVGASILDNPDPNKDSIDPGIAYNLSINEDTRETAEKIAQATKYGGPEVNERPVEKNPLINLNTTVSLKLFIKEIDRYIAKELTKKPDKKQNFYDGNYRRQINYDENKFLCRVGNTAALYQGIVSKGNVWVRWGWFEDNVLSKFLSVTSNAKGTPGESYNPIVTQFRSIERVLTTQGKDSSVNESVRIKNHSELQTIDINKYILPGQFYPSHPKEFKIDETSEPETLPGDSDYLKKLAKVTTEHFKSFATETDTIKTVVGTGEYETREEDIVEKHVDFTTLETVDVVVGTKTTNEELTKEVETTTSKPGKYGYLRNMLINTKLLKQAFGVDGDFTVESINVIEAIETLFSLLNQDLNFWNFRIAVDEIDTSRAKIIDEQITNFDFKKPTIEQKSVPNENLPFDVRHFDGTQKEGVFFFPVWQHDSMVKRQNVSAKIPNAMQLSVMYGSNMDQLKDFANPGSQFSQKEGVVMGGLFNTSADKHKEGLDIAFRNPITRKIGVKHGKGINDASIPLRPSGGKEDDIEKFLIDNADILENSFEERLKKLNTDLKVSTKHQKAFVKEYNESVPPPFPKDLNPDELELLLKYEKERETVFGFNKGELTKLLGSVYDEDGEMKPRFKKSLHYLTTQHGIYKQATTPLLIPLELELEIDGIGGIYPGNSFHSNYLPSRYQTATVFQAFDVNHRLDSSGWTVTLSGKMRATIDGVFQGYKTLKKLKEAQLENYILKAKGEEKKKKNPRFEADTSTVSRGPSMGSFR